MITVIAGPTQRECLQSPELRYNDIFRDFFFFFFFTSALIFVLFIGVFDGSVLLYFSTFQIIARFVENEIWDIIQFRGVLSSHF